MRIFMSSSIHFINHLSISAYVFDFNDLIVLQNCLGVCLSDFSMIVMSSKIFDLLVGAFTTTLNGFDDPERTILNYG